MVLTKNMFNKVMATSITNVIQSCYNVYFNECTNKKVVPLTIDEFGKAVSIDLKDQKTNK